MGTALSPDRAAETTGLSALCPCVAASRPPRRGVWGFGQGHVPPGSVRTRGTLQCTHSGWPRRARTLENRTVSLCSCIASLGSR